MPLVPIPHSKRTFAHACTQEARDGISCSCPVARLSLIIASASASVQALIPGTPRILIAQTSDKSKFPCCDQDRVMALSTSSIATVANVLA